jgi:hypothetical protein
MSNRDDVIALVLMAFGAFVLYESARMPRFEHLAVNPYTVPGLVPGFLGAALLLFGLVMLSRSLVTSRRPDPRAEEDAAEAQPAEEHQAEADTLELIGAAPPGAHAPAGAAVPRRGEGARRLLLTLALTLGYAGVLVGRAPFSLATFVFVFVFIILFDWRAAAAARRTTRLLATAGVQALLVAVAVTLVFERLFLVRLP